MTPREKRLFTNPSWPQGEWVVTYVKEIDRYRITIKLGVFVAEVGPTLAAYWIIDVYDLHRIAAERMTRGVGL